MNIEINKSKFGNHLNINIRSLCIETIAKNELDIDKAIEEAIISFCIISNKFGKGIQKEIELIKMG